MERSTLAALQGAYFAATGIWSLADVDSFQKITGPKRDIWLVKTVGALVTCIGGALLHAARRRTVAPETAVLAASSAAALAAIEVFYVARRRISPIYLADAAVEVGLLAAWAGAGVLTARAAGDCGREADPPAP